MTRARPTFRKSLSTRAAGYSGKSVAEKLGLKPGMRVALAGQPDDYWSLVEADPATMAQVARGGELELAHVFVQQRPALAKALQAFLPRLAPRGMLWISWPKKSSGVATDITEDTIRELALPMGLVDVKVCAVDATWSGLKLVRRKT